VFHPGAVAIPEEYLNWSVAKRDVHARQPTIKRQTPQELLKAASVETGLVQYGAHEGRESFQFTISFSSCRPQFVRVTA